MKPAAPSTIAPGKHRSLRRKAFSPRLTALAVLVVTLGLTLVSWRHQSDMEQAEDSARFSQESARVSAAIEERLGDYAQALRAGVALVTTNPGIGRPEWHAFCSQLELNQRLPGMLFLGYAPRIQADTLGGFLRRMRQDEKQTDFTIYPAGERPQYFPVAFLEPEQPVRRAFGFDLVSEANRREALNIARDTGSVALSAPIRLIMDDATQPGAALLMALPVYGHSLPPGSLQERRQTLSGYVFTGFRMTDFLGSLALSKNTQLSVTIYDDSNGNTPPLALLPEILASQKPLRQEERALYFGGRSWQLHLADMAKPTSSGDIPASQILLISGTTISLLLALLTLHLGSRRAVAEQLARQLSREWSDANTRLTSVFAALPDLMFELGPNRCFRQYHASSTDELFAPPARFLDRHPSEVLPGALATQLIRACDTIDDGEKLQILNYQLPRQDGEICDYEARITAIGKDGYLVVIRNVSDFRRAQQALEVANRKMQAVFDSATEVSIIATDINGLISVFNRGAEKMLGYQAAEMVGKLTPAILHLPEEVQERGQVLSEEFGWPVQGFEVFVTRARLTGVERQEWTYVRKDGSHLTVSLVVTAVYDESDNVAGFLGVAVDISALKAAEAELRRHRDHLQELVSERSADLLLAKESAEQANHTKSEFLANMSHELRTPMHAILSFAGLGVSRSSGMSGTEKLNHYFQRIKESGERLLELVNDLLDLSKLEAGKMSFNPRPTNLRPLIREAAGEMESLMQDKRLHLHISDEGPTDVFCDPLRFGQLIRNLLSNAIKFSPEGGSIRIGFSTSWLSAGRRTNDRGRLPAVEMTVSDEGIGIPVAERELVFDKFAQSSKTKTGAGGTGLGLAICREIVLAHRGTIVVRANTGPGTCLAVTLPTQDTHIATEDRS